MGGRARTYDTGQTRGTRRQRKHLPAGAAEQARRDKDHRGARALAQQRIDRSPDAVTALLAAANYVRSAASKYRAGGLIQPGIDALLRVGDEIYRNGAPRTRHSRR